MLTRKQTKKVKNFSIIYVEKHRRLNEREKNAFETNLVCDIEINDPVLVNNLNSIRLSRISVPSKLYFTKIALTKSPTQLIFSKSHSFSTMQLLLILLLPKVQYHHFSKNRWTQLWKSIRNNNFNLFFSVVTMNHVVLLFSFQCVTHELWYSR